MSTISDPVSAPPAHAAQSGYRTLWRWHFYAGLFVMPLLLVLAITGTIYCFQPQIEPLLYPHRLVVAPAATPRLPVDTLLARARAALPPDASGASQHWTLAQVVAQMRDLGVRDGYDIVLPATPDGVYTVSYFPPDPKAERTVYIDQYSGAVLKDIRYDDYGAVSQAISYGTSLHMGRYFGLANQLICAAISLGLGALAVTGFVMWWLRRPARAKGASMLAAPSRERAAPPLRAWKTGLVLLGIVFPLMGATLVAVWLFDRAAFRRA
ncbi:PepSY-associated TM helix domain-containing protein [Paraburkholderia sp. BR14262]|uniref:PepSY-associated TM helix domain-containing protein n=1 Tax=Paraburkholderia sp. BR14262 TaxID=3236999 RepID=UPI0034CF2B0D